jgi:UDP-glucuronate 4-epimerase
LDIIKLNSYQIKNLILFGIDNINNYYDVNLKIARLEKLKDYQSAQQDGRQEFRFEKIDLVEREQIFKLFEREKFDYVVHLAAQAGVRYSIENPYAYIESNIVGFINILELVENIRLSI